MSVPTTGRTYGSGPKGEPVPMPNYRCKATAKESDWIGLIALLYAAGVAVTATISAMEYASARGYAGSSSEMQRAAKWLIGAPIWPVLLLRTVRKTIREALETLRDSSNGDNA